jgi:hypothetical protein
LVHARRARDPRRGASGDRYFLQQLGCGPASSLSCADLGRDPVPDRPQLVLGACDVPRDKGERFAMMATGALAVWNVGIAFIVGMTAYILNKRGWLRL